MLAAVWSHVVPVVLLVIGAALLAMGAEAFAGNVAGASSHLGTSVVAGAVLLAGARPEEAVTAVLASGRGHPALAAGDAVGANLVILTLTLGLAAMRTRLPVSSRVVEYAVAATVTGALAALFLRNGVLDRSEGGVLVVVYVAGVVWLWWREQAPPVVGEPAEQDTGSTARTTDRETSRSLLMVLSGAVGVVVGGYLAVRGAEGLVDALGLRESVVGLTMLALATSAGIVALVWAARRRGLTEIVVAGAVGAVTYNATVTLGLSALVDPLLLGRHNPVLTMAVVTAVLPLVVLVGRRSGVLPRVVGALLVMGYVVSVGWLFAS